MAWILTKLKSEQNWTQCDEFRSFEEAFCEMHDRREKSAQLFSTGQSNKNYMISPRVEFDVRLRRI